MRYGPSCKYRTRRILLSKFILQGWLFTFTEFTAEDIAFALASQCRDDKPQPLEAIG